MIVTPGTSFCKIVFWIGDGPRSSGRREGCTLIEPYLGISIISFGKILPNEATTQKSASSGSFGKGFLLSVTFFIGESPAFSNSSKTYLEKGEEPKKTNLTFC